ncbi:MAG: porin [Cytophagales bacterium]|nr:porin [Cytophagales bacterium]
MKKLALIVAAGLVATGAMAQTASDTTTTVYGRVNVSIESQTVNDKTESAFQDNRSRIGFKMNRKIDKDLSVGATLEAGVNTAVGGTATGTSTNGSGGSGQFFSREATLNLTGGFGRVRLGKLPASDAYFATADYISNHNHDTGTSDDALFGHTTTGAFKNAIAYNGTTSGFDYSAAYGLRKNGNIDPTIPAGSSSPLALTAGYNMGALGLGAAYEKMGEAKAFTVRANYSIGAVLLGAYVESDSGKTSTGGDNGRTALRVSAMYTVGKSEYHLNVGRAGNRGGVADTGATQTTLFYNYNIDSKLKVYGSYTTVNNSANGAYGMSAIAATALAGTRSSSVGAGVRYNF